MCTRKDKNNDTKIEELRESFMYDSTEGNSVGKPKEAVMDYVISWTLRRAQEKYSICDKTLFEYCKRILCKLLDVEYSNDILFRRVETWKQDNDIDIRAEVEMEKNGKKELHCILIENKVYDPTRIESDGQNQLKKYKSYFDEKYKNTPNANKHYVLITCIKRSDDKFENQYSFVRGFGFKVFSVYDLHNSELPSTTSDIFNEFWKYL